MTTRLRRALGLGAVVFYVFGDILGAGIYALVGQVLRVAGGAAPLSFLVALTVATLTALSYAELASRHPRAGVEVFFLVRVFGNRQLASLVGWMVLCSAVVSAATVSRAFADYAGTLAPRLPGPVWVAGFLVLAAAINFRGIEISSRSNIVATVVEACGLLLVVVGGLAWLLRTGPGAVGVGIGSATDVSWIDVARGGALAFFAFIGFEDVVNISEEVKSPRRSMPRGILSALALAGLFYFGVTWVSTLALDPADLDQVETPVLLLVVARTSPIVPMVLFTLIAAFAVSNTGLLNSITASRLLYGMALQGMLPARLGEVHSARRTPHTAVVLVLVASLALALSGTVVFLAGTTSALLLAVFFIMNVALFVAKVSESGPGTSPVERTAVESESVTDTDPPFSVPSAVPLLAAVASLGLLAFVPLPSLVRAGALVLVGAAIIVATRVWRRRPTTP